MDQYQIQAIRNCKKSVEWFLTNFAKLKHPSAGILPFKPFNYQKKAIRDFRKHRLNIFRKCLAEGSMVWTPTGPMPIELLKKGDLVYSYNENLDIIEIDEIEAQWCNGEKETVEVRTNTGHRSYCTPDHPFHTDSGWTNANKLASSDTLTEVYDNPGYHKANESEAILLGYLLTDDCYSDCGAGEQFHFTNTNWECLLEYQKHFELLFHKRLSIELHNRAGTNKSKENSYRISSSYVAAKDWLVDHEIWGQKADTKHIPKCVFSWDNDSIAVLLNRIFVGNGWYSESHCNEVGIGSESVLMLHQIKQLLSRFQIDSKFYPASENSLAKLRILGTDNFEKFVKYGKARKCAPTTDGFFNNRKKGQIKSVRPSIVRKVYDLTVKKNSNFIVDGVVVHNCRQAGISKISGAFATWFAMFHSDKTILIVSRKNDDAMSFLRDNVVFIYENLPEWMKETWKPVKLNEHEIIFPNNSKIKSLTSHPDVLRSNASSLNIIDEAAFIQGMDVMWCVAPNTSVITQNGVDSILNVVEGDRLLGTDWRTCHKTYYTEQKAGYKITTTNGYSITCGEKHLLRSNGEMVKANELCVGDAIDMMAGHDFKGQYQELTSVYDNEFDLTGFEDNDHIDVTCSCGNQQTAEVADLKTRLAAGSLKSNHYICESCVDNPPSVALPSYLNEDLAELLGQFISKGYIRRGLQKLEICCDPSDIDAIDHTINNIRNLFGIDPDKISFSRHTSVIIKSAEIIKWLDKHLLLSKVSDFDAVIPKLIFRSPLSVIKAFLRGYFESAAECYDTIWCRPLSHTLAEQIHQLLLICGVVSSIDFTQGMTKSLVPRDGHNWDEDGWFVDIAKTRDIRVFVQQIGFISNRKIARTKKHTKVQVDPYLEFKEEITSIEPIVGPMCDITLDGDNLYLSNGFVSHNSAGWPTLQHGGSVIVISTTNGVGNWYWSTMTDAEAGLNGFNPIIVNWWDMDWAIEYADPLSLQTKRIAPRDGIRECTTPAEIEKYGPYWSPWLEEQYIALVEQDESWKFQQEILASFVGSGNTIIPKNVLSYIATTVTPPTKKISGYQTYVQPVTGDHESLSFDFSGEEEGFWIWREPVAPKPAKMRGDMVVEPAEPGHSYVMGVDIATGKGRDYSAIVVLDVNTMEQVAEFMARCLPKELVKYIDRIGRYYNSALAVVERNNGGDIIIDELRYTVMYPNLWRQKQINDKPRAAGSSGKQRALQVKQYGHSTTQASKSALNKFMLDYIRDNPDDGYSIYSTRLLKQFNTYVRKKDRLGRDTGKTEAEEGAANFDDLVIACALALRGAGDAYNVDSSNLMPVGSMSEFNTTGSSDEISPVYTPQQSMQDMLKQGGPNLIMPITMEHEELTSESIQRQIDAYTLQLGAIPISQGKPIVTDPKYFRK